MSSFLTTAGFKKLSLAEIRANLEAEHRIVFGSGVDLSPEGPLGQSVAISSKYLADTWEGLAEVYTARDPDTATGVALDELYAEIGLKRLEPTQARAPGVYLWTTYGMSTTIPAGSAIKADSSGSTYSLDSDVVVSGASMPTSALKGIRLRFKASYLPADEVALSLDGHGVYAAYGTHTSVSALAQELVSDIVNLGLGYSASVYTDSGNVYLQIIADSLHLISATGFTDDHDQWQVALTGDFTCDDYGAVSVPALSLDTIATPISDWISIYQPIAGISGTDTETDTEFRLRKAQGLRSGTATEDAIWAAVYRVPNVARVVVSSNRGMAQDAEGRPAKSFEVVVEGGANAAIAQAIWGAMPAGILPYGTFESPNIPTAVGKDGAVHQVNFSRPKAKYAWVRVIIQAYNSEESAPTDLVASIQDAVVSWGNTNLKLGSNFVRQRLYGPVLSIPGIESVSILIAVTGSASGTPSYSTPASIAIAAREYCTFSTERVDVEV